MFKELRTWRGIGDAVTHAGGVDTAGKEQANWLSVGGVDEERARIACIAEAVTADGDLIGEDFGVVGPGLGQSR